MSQLFFPFEHGNLYKEEDFLLLPENSAAFNCLKSFFTQNDFAVSRFNSLMLKGPRLCGKSHLLNIFAQKYEAKFLQQDELSQANLANFFVKNRFYILENIDEIFDEELLLRLVNSIYEANAFLVLSSNEEKLFNLKDLNSRLKNFLICEIKNPNLESIKQLIANALARRQIKLQKSLLDFMANHVQRNYQSIFATIKKVEFFCQENGRNITMKELQQICK